MFAGYMQVHDRVRELTGQSCELPYLVRELSYLPGLDTGAPGTVGVSWVRFGVTLVGAIWELPQR